MENEILVWVDIKDANKLIKISGFIPASEYFPKNRNEYGMVNQDNLCIRYRVTSFIKYIKDIFVE